VSASAFSWRRVCGDRAAAALEITAAGAVCGDAGGTIEGIACSSCRNASGLPDTGRSVKWRRFSALRSARAEISGACQRTCADLIQTSISIPQERDEIHVFLQ